MRAGRANAASGRIMVTVPGDHFGPIPPEADPRGLVRSKSFVLYLYYTILTIVMAHFIIYYPAASPCLPEISQAHVAPTVYQLMQPGESTTLNSPGKCKTA